MRKHLQGQQRLRIAGVRATNPVSRSLVMSQFAFSMPKASSTRSSVPKDKPIYPTILASLRFLGDGSLPRDKMRWDWRGNFSSKKPQPKNQTSMITMKIRDCAMWLVCEKYDFLKRPNVIR